MNVAEICSQLPPSVVYLNHEFFFITEAIIVVDLLNVRLHVDHTQALRRISFAPPPCVLDCNIEQAETSWDDTIDVT